MADASDVSWPGTEHFQVHDAIVGELPTYGVILPQTPLGTLRPETVAKWEAAISSGDHPTALVMCWIEQKDIVGEFTERFLVGVVLDGHHKLSAYARLRRPARVLAICRLEDSCRDGFERRSRPSMKARVPALDSSFRGDASSARRA